MIKRWLGVTTLALMFAAAPAVAIDVWDQATQGDNDSDTDNTLVHGAVQVHDLGSEAGLADEDWYAISMPSRSSFEVIVDGMTGDLNLGSTDVGLYDSDGTTLIQSSTAVSSGAEAWRIGWMNTTASTKMYYIRVAGAACSNTCTSNDQYTIRGRDTTIGLVRFNNSATQVSVFMAQNMSGSTITGEAYFWGPTGTLLATYPLSLGAKNLAVVALPGVAGLAGQAGSMTVAHNGRYATLNTKVVALEPATGFSFDTPGMIKP